MKISIALVSCLLGIVLSSAVFAGSASMENEQAAEINHGESMFSLYLVQHIQYEIRKPLEKELNEKMLILIEKAVITATELLNDEQSSSVGNHPTVSF